MSWVSLPCFGILRKALGSMFDCVLMCVCVVIFRMRCRARVAPPVDEFDNELSFWDEFLPLSHQLGVEVEVELEVDLV